MAYQELKQRRHRAPEVPVYEIPEHNQIKALKTPEVQEELDNIDEVLGYTALITEVES